MMYPRGGLLDDLHLGDIHAVFKRSNNNVYFSPSLSLYIYMYIYIYAEIHTHTYNDIHNIHYAIQTNNTRHTCGAQDSLRGSSVKIG